MKILNKNVWMIVICSLFFALPLSVNESFAGETYKWKMSSFFNPGRTQNNILKKFIALVEDRTAGSIQITLYESTLGHPRDHWEMLEKGVMNMAYLAEGFAQDRMPVGCLLNLPFELSNLNDIYDLYSKWMDAGYLKEVTDYFKVLFYRPTTPQNLFLCNKKILKMEDFYGLKIRTLQGMMGRMISALGASPVSMPGAELYMNMSTGVIDGTVTGPDFVLDTKISEVVKYGLRMPIYTGIWIAAMNKKTWNNLPKDLQDIIETTAIEIFKDDKLQAEADVNGYWERITNDTKMEIYTISSVEEERWKKAVSDIAKEYLDKWSAKGYPVKEAYAMMQEKVKMMK